MKVLILDVNGEHTNIMHRMMKISLACTAELIFFGPGYSSVEEMEEGLYPLIRRERVDAVLVAGYFLYSAAGLLGMDPPEAYKANRYLCSEYSVIEALYYCPRLMEELMVIDSVPRLYIICTDIQTLPLKYALAYRRLLENGFYLLGAGKDFVPKRSGRKFGHDGTNNNYLNIVEEYHERVVSVVAAGVSDVNYCFSSLKSRKYDWVIPGTIDYHYPQRLKAKNCLERSGYRVWSGNRYPNGLPYKSDRQTRFFYVQHRNRWEKLLHTVWQTDYIPNGISKEILAGYRENYLQGIRQSRCAYVEGSSSHVLVNKFLEVPAAGTLMIGDSFTGAGQMGFADGVNMIYCEPGNLAKEYNRLLKDKKYMQEVADNGRRLVMQKHSYYKKAKQIADSIEAIRQGRFQGSHWEHGDYIIEN